MTNIGRPALEPAVDQRADVGVALGDDALERRRDVLEAGEHLQPFDIGLAGVDGGLLVFKVGGALVHVLLGDGVGDDQGLPALERHLGQPGARLGAGEIGARLQQLLVEVRRLDLGERLAALHRRADVDLPVLHIAADAGEDRRPQIGLEPPRQIEAGDHRLGVQRRDRHRRDGLGLGPVPQLGAAVVARADAADDEKDDEAAEGDAGEAEPAMETALGRAVRHVEGSLRRWGLL